jgi:nitrile hydratase
MMPRFAAGDRVRVLDLGKAGHVRVPHYVRGAEGAVERHCGAFANPEDLAYGRPGLPPVDLYRVRISRAAIFPDAPAGDDLEIEIQDHWLAPAED